MQKGLFHSVINQELNCRAPGRREKTTSSSVLGFTVNVAAAGSAGARHFCGITAVSAWLGRRRGDVIHRDSSEAAVFCATEGEKISDGMCSGWWMRKTVALSSLVVFTGNVYAAGEADTGLIWAPPGLFFCSESHTFLFPSGTSLNGKKWIGNMGVTWSGPLCAPAASSAELALLSALFPTKTSSGFTEAVGKYESWGHSLKQERVG